MSLLRRTLVGALVLTALALPHPPGAAGHPDTFAPLVKAHRAKVVHIGTQNGRFPSRRGEQLLPFGLPEGRQGTGSGFIVSADGLIVTNHHVVADSDVIEVVLESGDEFLATLVGIDPHTDLALIKIEAGGLPFVRFGDSATMQVGDWVVAIGSPLGLDYSVTAGIISATGRNIFDSENLAYGEFLQTDAAINPGNSGGPLFNLAGDVIGVNTAISSKGFGIGFAVPSNLVVEVVRQLREHGQVLRGWIGVVIQEVTRDMVLSMRLPAGTYGILVEESVAGAPAFKAGIRPGDVLTHFGDQELVRVPQLQKLVAFSTPGSSVRLSALRAATDQSSWQPLTFSVEVGSPPGQRAALGQRLMRRLGLVVRAPAAGQRRLMGLEPGQGVLVERIEPGGKAAIVGLRKGDVILEADRQEVGTPNGLGNILHDAEAGRVPILVKRGRRVLFLVLPGAP